MKKLLVGMCLGFLSVSSVMAVKFTEKDVVLNYDNFSIVYIQKEKNVRSWMIR